MTVQHQFLRVHQLIYERSGGRVGHRMIGVPTLLLRSVGRRSGQPRTNALVYASDGDAYVVVASKGGAPTSPGWFFNVRANPDVEVQIGQDRRSARAEIVERGAPDYDRLWRLVNDNNHNRFEGYQRHTSRPIPLVVLRPR